MDLSALASPFIFFLKVLSPLANCYSDGFFQLQKIKKKQKNKISTRFSYKLKEAPVLNTLENSRGFNKPQALTSEHFRPSCHHRWEFYDCV